MLGYRTGMLGYRTGMLGYLFLPCGGLAVAIPVVCERLTY
jgi:hypothetical protein